MGNWKKENVPDHKFDFVDVHEFAKHDCFSRIKYLGVFFLVLKSVLVYLADIYNAGGLILIDKWMGQVKPPKGISFDVAKWIFVGSIGTSFLLLFLEVRKAKKIIASGDISVTFTNVVAKRYYALTSYSHWCLFEEITDQLKIFDRIAFFVFFSFKGWKRLIFCDGPRQIINALTLYAFFQKNGFSLNISKYGKLTTVASLGVMIFTVSVFAVSICLLSFAFLLYLPLLCKIRGNLKEYCCHLIDKRLAKMLKKQSAERAQKATKKVNNNMNGMNPTLPKFDNNMSRRNPTLPNLDNDPPPQPKFKQYGMQPPIDPYIMGRPKVPPPQGMYGADGFNVPYMGRPGGDLSQGLTSPTYAKKAEMIAYDTPGGQPIDYPPRPDSNNSNSAYSDTSTKYSLTQGIRPYQHPPQHSPQHPLQHPPQYPPQYSPQYPPQHPPQHPPHPYQQGGYNNVDSYSADYIIDDYHRDSQSMPYDYQNVPPPSQYYGENYYNDNNHPPPQDARFAPPIEGAIPSSQGPISPTSHTGYYQTQGGGGGGGGGFAY